MNTISKNLKKANDCFLRGEYEKSIDILTILKKDNPQLSHQFDSGIARANKKINPDDEAFEINFTDINALKISQNCVRTDNGLLSKQSNSTPGFKVTKYPNYVKNLPYEFCLEEFSASSDLVLFGLDSNEKLLFKKTISKNKTPSKIVIQLEPVDLHSLYLAFAKPNTGDILNFQKLKFSIKKISRVKLKNYSIAGMASIPGRNENLQKCVNSLVHQVDELRIFLNGYESIPSWLKSIENVKIFTSQEYDDLGDAGKFFTYDSSDCDYYFSVDDDILYPENYVSTLIQQAEKFGCPVGVHGSLFVFPYKGYYEKSGRYVHHFKDSNKAAKRVHVLGTGTLCIPKKIVPKIPKFLYPNMADIWFAEYCVHNQIPLICVPREFGWLNSLDDDIDSIYETNVESKTLQKQILEKKCEEFALKSLSLKSILPKIFIGIKTFNRFEYLKDCLDSLIKTINSEKYDLVIAVADDGSTDGTVEYLNNVKLPYEFHVIKNNRKYAPGQLNTLIDTAQKTNFDFLVVVDDDVIFKKQGWLDVYYESAIKSGYHHLCHFNLPHFAQLAERRNEKINPDAMSHSEHGLVAYKDVYSCMGALFTLTPDVVKKVGWADEVNFFVRGGWHIDYSARCCRAGFNEISRFFDVANSNEYIELQNTIASEYKTAIAWESEDFKRASTKEERLRRSLLIRDNSRIHVSKQDAFHGEFIKNVIANKVAVNDIFDDVFVINLDRRKDRLSNMDRFLGHLSINYNRFSAVNGQDSLVINQYKNYADKNFDFHREKLLSSKEFFLGDLPDVIRAEHIKAQVRGPAIRSVGAWAYLSTYEEILKKCWNSGKSHFLVFDDDCLFHKDFHNLFNDVVMQLPSDWKLLQLGTMQYDWSLIRNYSKSLYLPDGVLVASHAVGFHRDLIPLFLRYISYRTIPFDMGPLHYAARLYKEKSFVTIPNLVIQDNSESDIQSSDVASNASNLTQGNVYRWNYDDYLKLEDL
jgi:GR25 family glycosyltransferase involved in LPS biosynthesis